MKNNKKMMKEDVLLCIIALIFIITFITDMVGIVTVLMFQAYIVMVLTAVQLLTILQVYMLVPSIQRTME